MTDFNAIPLDGVDAIVATHNVAGSNGVLNAADDALQQYVEQHYASRGIDHIPYTGREDIQHFVLTPSPDELRAHALYRQKLAGMTFTPIRDVNELLNYGVRRAVYLPYIRLNDTYLPSEIDWIRYGLPPRVTLLLKDKGYMHNWLVQNGQSIHTPNFVSCDITYIPQFGMEMMRKIADMYYEVGMRDVYPLGLMIRGALSDGNYAMASIVEAHEDMMVGGQRVLRGQFMLKPDGKVDGLEIFETPEPALHRVLDHIRNRNDMAVDDRVVMSRLIDLEISPGLCTAITSGKIHDFAFNGQYIEPGNSACTGTSSFVAAAGMETAQNLSQQYLEQSQTLLHNILDGFFGQDDISSLYAMMNIDVMVVGALERRLFETVSATPSAAQYLGNFGAVNGDYAPRVYDPSVVLFAEVNPRDTNWTIAMKAVLQAMNQPCTVANLNRLADGQEMQVLARDHWDLPEGISLDRARELLLSFHGRLAEKGEGFIMRMSDNPAGVIAYTPAKDPKRLSEITQQAYDMLKQNMAVLG